MAASVPRAVDVEDDAHILAPCSSMLRSPLIEELALTTSFQFRRCRPNAPCRSAWMQFAQQEKNAGARDVQRSHRFILKCSHTSQSRWSLPRKVRKTGYCSSTNPCNEQPIHALQEASLDETNFPHCPNRPDDCRHRSDFDHGRIFRHAALRLAFVRVKECCEA